MPDFSTKILKQLAYVVPHIDMKILIKYSITDEWQAEFSASNKGLFYKLGNHRLSASTRPENLYEL